MKHLLWLILLVPVFAFGQGSVYSTTIVNRNGQPLAGANVAVCSVNPGPTPAVPPTCPLTPTYSDVSLASHCTAASGPTYGSGCANPGQSDAFGNVIIWGNPGVYYMEVYGPTINTYVTPIQLGGSGGGGGTSLQIQVGGAPAGSQTVLNLIAGTNMSITDNGTGGITFAASTGGAGGISGTLTQNKLPKASSTGTNPGVSDSTVSESGVPPVVSIPRLEQVRNAADFAWTQSPAGSLVGGTPATITLTPCPFGIIGADTTSYVYIAGTGTPEAVQLTGTGSCASGGASGTITFTPANSHAAGWTAASASGGIQEALNDAGFGVPNSAVKLAPTPGTSNAYHVYGSITPRGNNSYIDGAGAVLDCETRDRCINIISSAQVREIANIRFTTNLQLASVAITNAACSATTATITATNSYAAGQTIDIQNTFDSHYWGPHVVATASGSQFTYTVPSCSGFVSGTSAGGSNWLHAAVEDNNQGLTLRNVLFDNPGGFSGYFSNHVVVDNDQQFALRDTTTTGNGHCDANYCSNGLYAPGPFSTNPAVITIDHYNASMNCQMNGVRDYAGNTLNISNTVIQGYNQFAQQTGIFRGGFGPSKLDNVYNEIGSCLNPLYISGTYPSGLGAQAGVIAQGQSLTITAGETGVAGAFPKFTTAGSGGATQKNYWIVACDNVLGCSRPLYIGSATPTGGGNITVNWPRIQGSNTLTYNLLVTTGAGQAVTAPNGTANYMVHNGANLTQTSASCNTALICSFNDDQTAAGSYPVPSALYIPALWYWPGAVVLTNSQDNAAPSVLYIDRYQGGVIAEATEGSNSSSINYTSVYAKQCSPGTISSPLLVACQDSDPSTAGNTNASGALMLRDGIYGGSTGGLKGRLNFTNPAGNFSLPATHIITLGDSNVEKTLATPGNRPTADANDTWIGYDQTTNVNPTLFQLALGSPISISQYIGNVGNGSSWLERLTSAAKTFNVALVTIGNSTTVDFSSGVATLPSAVGTFGTIPASCKVGQFYFANDQPAGANLYACTAANVWTLETGGGGGGSIPGTGFQVVLGDGGTGHVATGLFCSNAACDTLMIPGALQSTSSSPWSLQGLFPASVQMTAAPAGQSKLGFGLTNGKLVLSANGGTVLEVPQRGDINLNDILLTNFCSLFSTVNVCAPSSGALLIQNGGTGATLNVAGPYTTSTNYSFLRNSWAAGLGGFYSGPDHGTSGGVYYPWYWGTEGSTNPLWVMSGCPSGNPCTPGIIAPTAGNPNPELGTVNTPLGNVYAGQGTGGVNTAGDISTIYTTAVAGLKVGYIAMPDNHTPFQAVLATTQSGPTLSGLLGVVSRVQFPSTLSGTIVNPLIISGGTGWTSNPTCSISAPFQYPGAVTATCTATEAAGAINAFTITLAGSGYRSPPTITLTGGGGTGAILTVDVSATGGSASIANIGIASCYFDAAVATRDWVVPSSITDGMCHDSGIPWGQPKPQSKTVLGVSTTACATAGYCNIAVIPDQEGMLEFHTGANSCATGTTAGATCNTIISFPGSLTFPDTNYRAFCSGVAVSSGVPVMGAISSKATNQFQQAVVKVDPAVVAAKFTDVDCLVVHD